MSLEKDLHRRLAIATYRATEVVVTPTFVRRELAPLLTEQVFLDRYPESTRARIDIGKAHEIASSEGWNVHGLINEMLKPSSPAFWGKILDQAPEEHVVTMARAIEELKIARIVENAGMTVSAADVTLTPEALANVRRTLPQTVSENNAGFYGLSLQYFALAALFGSRFQEVIPYLGGQVTIGEDKVSLFQQGLFTEADFEPVPIFTAANTAAGAFGSMARNFAEFFQRLTQLFPQTITANDENAYTLLENQHAFHGPKNKCPAKDPVTVALFEGFGQILADPQIGLEKIWEPRIARRRS